VPPPSSTAQVSCYSTTTAERSTPVSFASRCNHPRGWAVAVVVGGSRAPEKALLAVRAGACAVIHRAREPRLLSTAVAAARAGQPWMDPELAADIILGRPGAGLVAALRAGLTPRENEVLDGICLGLSNAEMAGSMHVSTRTVKFHVSNILNKLGVRGREQVIALCSRGEFPGLEYRLDPVLEAVENQMPAP
jgi:DNA-binding NarL/FixJ family response regulator